MSANPYLGFHSINYWVSNARVSASYYCTSYGFERLAYKGLETGSRDFATHVIRKNDITFTFTSPLNPGETTINTELARSGDFVRDISFSVTDCESVYKKAIEKGGVSVREPETLKDEHGEVTIATVAGLGNVQHSFIQHNGYQGAYLPGFKAVTVPHPPNKVLPETHLDFIDHIVTNVDNDHLDESVEFYLNVFNFKQFWSVSQEDICTEFSSLRSIVVSDPDEKIKLPINEPADGKRKKSQIKEFVEYHGDAGAQHIALHTENIMEAIPALVARGVEFLYVPDTYYENLRLRLKKSPVVIEEDLDEIQRLGILVDFDDKGYLLQLFTKPLEDRPTLFIEIINRRNNSSFGAGNFKALFEAIEREQELRGNL